MQYNAMSMGRSQPGSLDSEMSALTMRPAHLTNLLEWLDYLKQLQVEGLKPADTAQQFQLIRNLSLCPGGPAS